MKLTLKPALLLAEAEHGAVYSFTRVDGDFWEVKRYSGVGSIVSVGAVDQAGEPTDWDTLEDAQAAAELHSELVKAGAQADYAVLDVQRVMCRADQRKAS
jgi:hypothetical protein